MSFEVAFIKRACSSNYESFIYFYSPTLPTASCGKWEKCEIESAAAVGLAIKINVINCVMNNKKFWRKYAVAT